MEVNINEKKYINPKEFELLYSIGIDAQSIWRSKKIIPYIKLGGKKILYDREKIENWISKHEVLIDIN